MNPTSFSASALNVHELCPARYKAENIDRSKGFGGTAATLGTTVHGALEMFVKRCFLEDTEEPTWDLLHEMFKLSYVATFGTTDYETVEYMDGYSMLQGWHKREIKERDYFRKPGHRVISCEIKTNFMVPTSIGEIPFNYIWDRFDQIGEREFKVVDYKSNRWNIQPEDLRKKIQARAYGMAAAIQLKSQGIEYDVIWVEFDMLRFDRVGISFTREDNKAFWKYLTESAEQIIATPDDEVQEKLNPECLFCVRKADCDALRKNILVGGIHSLATIEDAIDLRAQLEWQKKGLESLIKDIDVKILTEAKERDSQNFESADNRLDITVSGRRKVDAEMVEMCVGSDVFNRYGGKSITLTKVDALLKSNDITPEQKAQLRSLIYTTYGEPSVKVTPKNPIDDD